MPFGFTGSVLRVNLSDEKTTLDHPDEGLYRKHLGGMGFVVYYLLKELRPGVDPLGPFNKLIFAPGPLTGAPIQGTARNSIGGKSPLTGALGESEVGGFWGVELKRAGIDAIVVEGKAPNPVYLWIHDTEAEIRDAHSLWGKNTDDSEELIRNELGDKLVRVAQIGPAGERMVRYACVVNDLTHVAGRTGMGAVMGSKNLKAIAVRGHRAIEFADTAKLLELAKWFSSSMMDKDTLGGRLHEFGTGALMEEMAEMGNLPTRNFKDGPSPNFHAISPQRIKETVRVGMEGCYACSIRCKKMVKIETPYQVDPKFGGPEYETLAALGTDCDIYSLEAVCKANELCQKFSIDTISLGATIAFVMECYENGLLNKRDTTNLEPRFGNVQAMMDLTKMIAYRQGIGDLLAEGTKRSSEKLGHGTDRCAIHVKGQEVPMHEPRLKPGLGLGYAISPTGADHQHNIHDTWLDWGKLRTLGILEAIPVHDIGPKKVRILTYSVTWSALNNSLLLCDFVGWSYQQKADIVKAVTGWNTTTFELMKAGERTLNMARMFNIREGLTPRDDWLPERFFQPHTSGPLSGTSLNAQDLERAKRIYYAMMGWDEDSGVPSVAKLHELDIAWLADERNAR